jgi:hypothetical protein
MAEGGGWARRAVAASVPWLIACTFDDSGLGGQGGSADETSSSSTGSTTRSGETETTKGTSATSTSIGESGAADSSDDTSTPTTGIDDGQAVLEFSDPQSHGNFGPVDLGENHVRVMTLTNVGGATATQLGWSGVAAPFEFTGGTYPGVGGDCSDVLDAGDSCEIELLFAPNEPGQAAGELTVHYSDAGTPQLTTRELVGYGVGATANLLINGDAEACTSQGQDPPGWTKYSGSGWQCGNPHGVEPHDGRWSLAAGSESSGGTFELRQNVDVSAYLGFSFSFAGWARSLSNGDDDYRIDLVFLDENEDALGEWSFGWHTHTQWHHHEHALAAPPMTRMVSVRLFCTKGTLGSWCDAYFDGLELRAVYSAPG